MTTTIIGPSRWADLAADPPRSGPVFLFPGLTVHPGDLIQDRLAAHSGAAKIAEEINDAARAVHRPPVFSLASVPQLRDTQDGESLELGAFALSVAGYEYAASEAGPHRLLGHSFGQATALTCARVFTVTEGASLILLRYQALRSVPDTSATSMACLGLPAAGTHEMINQLENATLAVACHNAPDQTVISGPVNSLAQARREARRRHVPYMGLPATCAFHTPWAGPIADFMRDATSGFRQHPLQVPVYSATLSRYCLDTDDLLEEMIADLTRPVYFLEAVRALHQADDVRFLECGVKPMLVRMVNKIAPGAYATHGTELSP